MSVAQTAMQHIMHAVVFPPDFANKGMLTAAHSCVALLTTSCALCTLLEFSLVATVDAAAP